MDGIPTTNAYLDNTAISVGIAIQSGVVLQKCGNYWCRINTSQVINSSLIDSTSSNVVSLTENYQYNNCSSWITQNKGLTKIANQCAVAANGLMYDNCELGLKSKASFYECQNKDMRVPIASETRGWNVNGVPSCGGITWTNTYHSYGNGGYCYWNGTSTSCKDDKDGANDLHFIRCVK
ncbi:hypothetical protein [Aliarcobacter butzleri]|uniref:hypothetical protein n=1 Tax=Aliarcobacter butzleri TaxID=28197 RepID=UPI002B248D3D|nr:hypothetical protein [Aliarcobacter butzleri]